MPTPDWTLDALFAPDGWARFLADGWQQRAWHVARADPSYFSALACSDDVDFLLATHCGHDEFALSVMGSHLGTAVPQSERGVPRRAWTPERVYARMASGATVRIGNAARYLPAVARIAKTFERGLQTDIRVNLYRTPSGARAFEAHYDNHDVFILQVEGRKRWRLFQEAERWPVEVVHRGRLDWHVADAAHGFSPPTATEGPAREYVLDAGDLLYVPRGHVHQVSTLDDAPSLHLTVAAPVVTWYEVCVQALLESLRHSPALREALPVDFSTAPQRIPDDQYAAVAAAVAEHLSADTLRRALHATAQRFRDSRRDHGQGMSRRIERIPQLAPDQRLRLRPDIAWTLERETTHLVVRFEGRMLPVPVRCESMLDHLLAQPSFRPAELPTQLDAESRLVFCRAALQAGLIEFVDDADAG